MKTFQLLCPLLILTLISSCNQDDDPSPDPSPAAYYNLNVGSYWIYQWYSIDTLGVETVQTNNIDTVRNVADTIINGNQYVVQRGTLLGTPLNDKFLRDLNGDLVNEQGIISFSSTNFTDIFLRDTIGPNGDPWIITNYQMASSEPEEITTMAGTFSCLNFQGTHESVRPSFPWENRLTDNYYSIGIGEIQSSTFYASSSNNLERRLIEFELK